MPQTATPQEIKKAFRKLAKQYHPDRNKDPMATQLFIQVEEAYTCLSSPKTRERYDRLLKYGHSTASSNRRKKRKTSSRSNTNTADREYMRRKSQEARAKAHRRANMKYRRYRVAQPDTGDWRKGVVIFLAVLFAIIFAFESGPSAIFIILGLGAVVFIAFYATSKGR